MSGLTQLTLSAFPAVVECPDVELPPVEHGCFWLPRRDANGCVSLYDVRCDWPPGTANCSAIAAPDDPAACAWVTLHDADGCVTGFECGPS